MSQVQQPAGPCDEITGRGVPPASRALPRVLVCHTALKPVSTFASPACASVVSRDGQCVFLLVFQSTQTDCVHLRCYRPGKSPFIPSGPRPVMS